MKIGIIGAENSHCAGVAKTLNLDKLVPGFEVTHVWGETREFAEKAAEKGGIPTIVDNQTDMIGHIEDPVIYEACNILKQICAYFELLGSYPRADDINLNGGID